MEADDCELSEVEPRGFKKVVPIVHKSVNDRAAVKLHALCIEDLALVNGQGFEGALCYLEGLCALEDRHGTTTSGRGTNVISCAGLERTVMVLVGGAKRVEFLINGAPQKHDTLR
jgi:hypothetical protein